MAIRVIRRVIVIGGGDRPKPTGNPFAIGLLIAVVVIIVLEVIQG